MQPDYNSIARTIPSSLLDSTVSTCNVVSTWCVPSPDEVDAIVGVMPLLELDDCELVSKGSCSESTAVGGRI
jgi:hypothetical protein